MTKTDSNSGFLLLCYIKSLFRSKFNHLIYILTHHIHSSWCRTLHSYNCTLHRPRNSDWNDKLWNTLGVLPCGQRSHLQKICDHKPQPPYPHLLVPLPPLILCFWRLHIMEAQARMVEPWVIRGIHDHHHCHLPLHGTMSRTRHGVVGAIYAMASRHISLP